jgi:predicted AlkP superfamily phosphohydrolase/phosphomutase
MLELRRKPNLTAEERAELEEMGKRADVRVPFTVEWTRGSDSATIDIQGQRFTLKAREWSKWVDLSFRVNVFITVRGMAQFFLVKAGDDLQLYVSPVNWRPEAPPMPMSSPDTFSQTLAKALVRFRTLGWAEATWPLEEGRIDEQAFMEDSYRAFDDRAQVILNRLAAGNWELLIGVIETTDRVEHMMWRLHDTQHPMYDEALARKFGDSIASIYRRSDQFVGEVMQQVGPDVAILIVSDHGFNSFRKAVNLNTWLVQEGFMTLSAGESEEKRLDDLFVAGTFWEHVDWSRTRAYAMGLGQIYFNLRGREGQGIVSPGAEATALADSISGRLLQLTDPDTGETVVQGVYKRDDVYKGAYLENASDLQVGFKDGYRVSWQTSLGGAPAGIMYPNMKRWSGDHGSFDYAGTAGTLISSTKLAGTRYNVMDVGPSVLRYFGIDPPGDMDGKSFF